MTFTEKIGYAFRSPELFQQSLTHTSYFNENPKAVIGDNERLEFLGDAVLDLVISEKLYLSYQNYNEGQLSKARASLVNETTLFEIAGRLNLSEEMLLGRGEAASGGAQKPRLVASALEALLGAIYLDGGLEAARSIILSLFDPYLEKLDQEVHFKNDFKSRLQEKSQEIKRLTPEYVLQREEGPDHAKVFYVEIKIGDQIVSEGAGRTKKQAEQEAAKKALEGFL